MRDIDKIRVWDPDIEEMTYMETWEDLLSWKSEMYEESIAIHSTGLNIKGTNLYDGDIIKGKWMLGQYHYNYGVIRFLDEITAIDYSIYFGWVVEWIKNKPNSERKYSRIKGNIKSFEIIGNIYENPELLK